MNKVLLSFVATLAVVFFTLSSFTGSNIAHEDDAWDGVGTITWKAESVKGYSAEGGFKHFRFNHLDFPTGSFGSVEAEIEIDISSVFEKSDGLVKHLLAWDFFDVEKHPTAVVYISEVNESGENTYEGMADVMIKGIKGKCPITMTVQTNGDAQRVSGVLSVTRGEFEVGMPLEKYAEGITPVIETHFDIEVPKN